MFFLFFILFLVWGRRILKSDCLIQKKNASVSIEWFTKKYKLIRRWVQRANKKYKFESFQRVEFPLWWGELTIVELLPNHQSECLSTKREAAIANLHPRHYLVWRSICEFHDPQLTFLIQEDTWAILRYFEHCEFILFRLNLEIPWFISLILIHFLEFY